MLSSGRRARLVGSLAALVIAAALAAPPMYARAATNDESTNGSTTSNDSGSSKDSKSEKEPKSKKDSKSKKESESKKDADDTAKRVKKSNACKVLKRAQIEEVLGGDAQRVARRRVGPDVECDWTVAASGERPAGSLSIGVSFDIPPGAYPALTNNPGFEVVEGIGDAEALYQAFTGTVNLFKGRRILKVRGIFNDVSTRPIRSYDARTELLELATLAETRL